MSLDIYVGPLCRYFAHDWETMAAQFARQSGASFQTITPSGQRTRADPREYRDAMLGWRRLISPTLLRAGVRRVEWDERIIAPYLTEQLPWPHYWALRLRAAYAEVTDLTEPEELPSDDLLQQDAALEAVRSLGEASRVSHLHQCEWWLPVDLRHPVEVELPSGHKSHIGSCARLCEQLRALLPELRSVQTPLSGDAVEAGERLLRLGECACEQSLPMLMDY